MNALDGLRAEWRATRDDPERAAATINSLVMRLPMLGIENASPLSQRRWMSDVDAPQLVRNLMQLIDERASDEQLLAAIDAATTPATPAALVTRHWSFDPAPRSWLIPDWLPLGRVVLLAGEGGRGKSRLALQIAEAVAAGRSRWLDGAPHWTDAPAAAIIGTWEDDAVEIRRRLADNPALHRGVSNECSIGERIEQRVGSRLIVTDMAASGALWAPAARDGHISTMGALTAAGEWIRAVAEAEHARLLVIDPLAAAFSCNENDRGLVRAFMSSWDAWARAHSCTTLIIAHPPKSAAAYAGSTDWHAAARAVWTLEDVDGATQLSCIKSSYGPRPPKLRLSRWQWWSAELWDQPASDTTPALWSDPPE